MNELSHIPSLDEILQLEQAKDLESEIGHKFLVDILRMVLDDIRSDAKSHTPVPDHLEILQQVKRRLKGFFSNGLISVINATGVILHTNLGRAPLCQSAIIAMKNASEGYSTLEYNLADGKRGDRAIHIEKLLTTLTKAESALVVNNNAAAVLLILSVLAKRKRVIISRTQLIEIGGGFRIPEVMQQSGAKLVGIGTTNRVHLADYESALHEPAAMILVAHHSNFRIIGFTSEPSLIEVVQLAHQYKIPLIHDLGSGALMDTAQYGLAHEPTVQESLSAGVDLTCFSGDKLLGGPQAGIIVGCADLIERIKKHPLARSLRADKLCLAGLNATLWHYLREDVVSEIPVWQMISMSVDEIQARAKKWSKELGVGEIIQGNSMVGGGSLPGESLPTYLFSIKINNAAQLLKKLRQQSIPIIARIESEMVVFDPRTVLSSQDQIFISEMKTVLDS
jgi:L-seryl-tRNA(Ser) seleniumtransferase